MNKKILSLFVVGTLCLTMAFAASAMAQSPTQDAYSGIAGQLQGGGGGSSPDAVAGTGSSGGGGNDTLPFTGFEVGLAAVLGLAMLGTGLVLRRGVRSAT